MIKQNSPCKFAKAVKSEYNKDYLFENFLEYKNRYITGFLLIFVACALLTDSLYGLSKALIILISSIFYAIKHMIKTINCKIWTYIFILTFSS